MAEQIDDGGPAFPRPYSETEPGPYGTCYGGQEGMSLRDWFAGQALAGICAHYGDRCLLNDNDPDRWAEECYGLADAMIAQRKARHG